MAWSENNYIETRFVGGMNNSVEPHTLDRDTGELPDIMNMQCRTQGLRTRKGWAVVDDLATDYSTLPTVAPSGLFCYESALPQEDESGEGGSDDEGGDNAGGGVVVPIDDGGGGGGKVIPRREPKKEKPAEEPSNAWSLAASAQTVMPYVPFDLTITRLSGAGTPYWLGASLLPSSAGAYSGTCGNLVQLTSASWKREVMVRNLGRSISGVKYMAGPNSSVHADCQVGYVLYSFVPDLPDKVEQDTQFNFKVECKYNGNVVTGYRGAGRGCELVWRFYGKDGNELRGSATTSSMSWSNGVLTGKCKAVCSGAQCVVLETRFLGETLKDDAKMGDFLLRIDAPSYLHIYGKGDLLELSVDMDGDFVPANLRVLCSSGGRPVELGDVLELAESEGGSREIDFASGWIGKEWSKDIRAKSDSVVAEGPLSLTFSYEHGGETYSRSVDIRIESVLLGLLASDENIIYSGVPFTLSAELYSEHDELDWFRFPFGSLSLVGESGFEVAPEDDIDSSLSWNDGMAYGSSCNVTGTGDLTIALLWSGIELASCSLAVLESRSLLVEAINERFEAKGDNARASDQDTAVELRNKAISACAGYVNASGVAADGSCTTYASSGSGAIDIVAADDLPSWYQEAYEKVCETTQRVGTASMQTRSKASSGSYHYDPVWDSDAGDWTENGTESGAKSNALSLYNSAKATSDWGDASSMTAYYTGLTAQDYKAWRADLAGCIYDFRAKAGGSSTFSRKADYYFAASTNAGTYDNLGHHSLASGQTGKLGSDECAANESFDWKTWDVGALSHSWSAYHGYKLTFSKCIITYGFVHK